MVGCAAGEGHLDAQDAASRATVARSLASGIDPKTKAVLVELPHEAETGANRLWVLPKQLDEPAEALV